MSDVFYLGHRTGTEPWTVLALPAARFSNDVFQVIDLARSRLYAGIDLEVLERNDKARFDAIIKARS